MIEVFHKTWVNEHIVGDCAVLSELDTEEEHVFLYFNEQDKLLVLYCFAFESRFAIVISSLSKNINSSGTVFNKENS